MSPIIFLLTFNPVIQLAKKLQSPGFFFKIPIADTEDLPVPGATIYVEWDESASDEEPGWYKSVVSSYDFEGKATLLYSNHSTETLDLKQVNWKHARRNFRPVSSEPPTFTPSTCSSQQKTYVSSEHRIKAFADDLTIISSSFSSHTSALQQIDSSCSDLDLHLRPDKCVTLSFNGKKFDRKAVVELQNGSTINISKQPAKLLGRLIGTNRSSTTLPSCNLFENFRSAILSIDKRPVRGEYKLWIYRHYLAPATHFHLAVNVLSKSILSRMESFATKMLKKWLNLPKNATKVILHHPQVLKCPQVSYMHSKASLSYLVAIKGSTDTLIQELQPLLNSSTFRDHLGFSSDCFDLFEVAKQSATSIPSLKRSCTKRVSSAQSSHWNEHLKSLTVQNKFLDIISLENEENVWSKLLKSGLPQGQLSFLLKAGSDTLPTAMNLKRMKIQFDSRCKLCGGPRSTTAHILSYCREALEQGRFTWRHDSVLLSLVNSIKPFLKSDEIIYADLNGLRFDESPPATIPSSIMVTPLRPDMVLFSNSTKRISIIELTVPNNTPDGLAQARHRKQEKQEYNILVEDISAKEWCVSYDTIEVGSLGHFTKDSVNALVSLLPTVDTDPRLATRQSKQALLQASRVASYCSKSIFLARNHPSWFKDKQLLIIIIVSYVCITHHSLYHNPVIKN